MKKKGYALPIAVFTGIFILTMLFILFNVIFNQITLSQKNIERAKKEYMFEAAKQEGIFEIISCVQRDIKNNYNVSYKASDLNDITGQLPNGEKYLIKFLPSKIDYDLEKLENRFIIKSLKNNTFIIKIIHKQNNEEVDLKLEVDIKDGNLTYLIKE